MEDREGRKAEEAHRTVDTGPVNVMVTFWGWGGVPIGRLTVYTSSSRRRSARNGVEKDTCIVAMEEHTMVMVSMTRKVEEKFFIVVMMMMMMISFGSIPSSYSIYLL